MGQTGPGWCAASHDNIGQIPRALSKKTLLIDVLRRLPERSWFSGNLRDSGAVGALSASGCDNKPGRFCPRSESSSAAVLEIFKPVSPMWFFFFWIYVIDCIQVSSCTAVY